MTEQWIYEHAADKSARFVLGAVVEKPLVCFGINPSTAVPNAPDRTVGRVMRFAADDGFDSWTMLNLYPSRSTSSMTEPSARLSTSRFRTERPGIVSSVSVMYAASASES